MLRFAGATRRGHRYGLRWACSTPRMGASRLEKPRDKARVSREGTLRNCLLEFVNDSIKGESRAMSGTRLISLQRFLQLIVFFACGCEVVPLIAADPADTPESVLSAYIETPTAEWQNRLQYVAEPEKARPIMEKWYADKVLVSSRSNVTSVSGATDPSLYRNIGDALKVSLIAENREGQKVNKAFFVVRTADGFKVDWLKSFKAELVSEGLWEEGRIAIETKVPEIAVKHLEAVGERYANKSIKMLTLRYEDITSIWLVNLPGVMVDSDGLVTRYDKKAAEGWVGFSVTDRNGKHGSKFFARKDKWADMLLEFKRGQLINIVGVVTPMEQMSDYGVLVYDIEVLK
jgi:hypothetical protein